MSVWTNSSPTTFKKKKLKCLNRSTDKQSQFVPLQWWRLIWTLTNLITLPSTIVWSIMCTPSCVKYSSYQSMFEALEGRNHCPWMELGLYKRNHYPMFIIYPWIITEEKGDKEILLGLASSLSAYALLL